MARQIATASGPCGNNREYLFLLEKATYDIGHEDDYVIELANEVRKILGIVVVGVATTKRLVGYSSIVPKAFILAILNGILSRRHGLLTMDAITKRNE